MPQGVGPACTEAMDGGVTLEERQLILQEHNRLRSHVASGSETRGLPDTVPQPPAANMMALVQLFAYSYPSSWARLSHNEFRSAWDVLDGKIEGKHSA